MTFRLRICNMGSGAVLPDTGLTTENAVEAREAFERYVNRTDLDGRPLSAVVSFNQSILAVHRFDRPGPGRQNWRGRVMEIKWPDRVFP